MEKPGGFSGALGAASSALSAYATGVGIIAHNVANVSTDDFHPLRTDYQAKGNGVKAVVVPETEGGAISRGDGEKVELPSGVELEREFSRLIVSQRAFEANARVITTIDDAMGTLLNING